VSELSGQVALVAGGGRGIGASIARELAAAGMRVAVAARTAEQVERVAQEIAGLALAGDVSVPADAVRLAEQTEQRLGPIDLLVCNAGTDVGEDDRSAWEVPAEDWWRVFEVNVRGPYLLWRAAIPGMLERGRGRIVNTGSGASWLPGLAGSAYAGSKAALHRATEVLARQLAPHGLAAFAFSPGLVRTEMTEGRFPDDAPWTPPECAPRLVRALASGRYDALAGRFLHAEHDADLDALLARIDDVRERDLNAIRLQRG
jgi:NAD(P)-dependent dehydrogenase (short-subunit alcohol dehydrogenase family)